MVDTEIFSRRLDALDGYLGRLRSLGEAAEEEYLAEPGIHDLAARYLHLAIEAAIDLANHWIADHGFRTPDSNRDTFTVLEEAGEIEAALAERMRGLGRVSQRARPRVHQHRSPYRLRCGPQRARRSRGFPGMGVGEDRIAMKMCLGGPPPGAASPRIEPVSCMILLYGRMFVAHRHFRESRNPDSFSMCGDVRRRAVERSTVSSNLRSSQ